VQATAERPSPPAATRARIVLVEDDRNSGEAICELLGFLGYDCRWLGTAEAAFALLTDAAEGERDVLMLDLALRHGEDGVGLVRRLRESGAQVPPILIFSARPAAVLEQAMRETGAHGILVKPAGVDEMCRAIDAAMASRPASH
jgi:DNA-binding response OmpR family regulator